MESRRIILSGFWVATMLVYLLGDVMRIFAGDFEPGNLSGMQPSQMVWLGMAALMLIPILMAVLTLTLPHPAIRWLNIIVAAFWFIFNLVGLPTYPGYYDMFLLAVSMVFNLITVWYAWKWVG